MSDTTWIQNISQLGALPSQVFEKICRAVGMAYEPTHIRKLAAAKADEIRTLALGVADASDIRVRAAMRIETEQLRHQQNIEAITLKSLHHLTDQAKPDNVDDEWVAQFFELARNATKDDVQTLWSRILASEFNSPDSFSKRTLRMVADFDRNDAVLFSTLCRFAVNKCSIPIVFDPTAPIYRDNGITYTALAHLENIGLIRFSDAPTFRITNTPFPILLDYFQHRVALVRNAPSEKAADLIVGHCMLLQPGIELARICQVSPVDGFLDYLIPKLRSYNFVVTIVQDIVPDQPA